MAKMREGDSLNGLSAGSWNRHEEVADWYFRNVAHGDPKNYGRQTPPPAGAILIKNSSSADRRLGEILKVGDYLNTGLNFAEFRQYPWFDTAIHDGTDAPVCVLLHPIPNGDFGWAQISGVCPALVNFSHADMRYARPAASNDVLQADVLGQVRVLYKPSGTGEKECLVDLGGGRFNGWGVADAAISEGSSGTVSFWNGLAGAEADSGMNCTAYAEFHAIDSAARVGLTLMNNVLYATLLGCP